MSLYSHFCHNCGGGGNGKDIEDAVGGCVCRCTGYRSILSAAREYRDGLPLENERAGRKVFKVSQNRKLAAVMAQSTGIARMGPPLYRPGTLRQLLELRIRHPDAELISWTCHRPRNRLSDEEDDHFRPSIVITNVPELRHYHFDRAYMEFGAGLTYSQLEDVFAHGAVCGSLDPHLSAFARHVISSISSAQVRNTSTIAGGLLDGSGLSDVKMLLLALKGELTFESQHGQWHISVSEFLDQGRRVPHGEICMLVKLHAPQESPFFLRYYRQGKGRKGDRPAVNAAFCVSVDQDMRVTAAIMLFGGVEKHNKIARAKAAENAVLNRCVGSPDTFRAALHGLWADMESSWPQESIQQNYRRSIICAFLFKFFREIEHETGREALDKLTRPESPGPNSQHFGTDPQFMFPRMGHDGPILSPYLLTGEAEFLADSAGVPNQLYGRLVLSSKARARILRIDTTKCEKVPGFVGFVDQSILEQHPELNFLDSPSNDTVFANSEVFCSGQIIGIAIAETAAAAAAAAHAITIDYEVLSPTLSISDAIAKSDFFDGFSPKVIRGDVDVAMGECDHVLSGTVRIGGQSHFYLETHSCRVIPQRDGSLEVWSTTQAPTQV
jgi:xanthine dehydrogenase/oxidase